jgi:hypothetical protein
MVKNEAKNVASDEFCHTDDILCLAVSGNFAASGQIGS